MQQPTFTIGVIGPVSHGKTTLVKALTHVSTVRFKREQERNMTIKLGYANGKFFHCSQCDTYDSFSSSCTSTNCSKCDSTMYCKRHISFVDSPGHEQYVSTMIGSLSSLDAIFLVLACNQPCSTEFQSLLKTTNKIPVCILQTKIDLCTMEQATEHYESIQELYPNCSEIIPISSTLRGNIHEVCEYICEKLPVSSMRNKKGFARLSILRSFDINHPGTRCDKLQGGVIGGRLLEGTLRVGQTIEIRPGFSNRSGENIPLVTEILSIQSEQQTLTEAIPGGLIGIKTTLDPCLCRADRLVGQLMGEIKTLYKNLKQIQENGRQS